MMANLGARAQWAGSIMDQGLLYAAQNRAAAASPPSFVRSWTNSSAGAQVLTISAADMTGGNFLVVASAQKNGTGRPFAAVTCNGGAQTLNTNQIVNLAAAAGKLGIWSIANPVTGDITVNLGVGTATQGFHIIALLFNLATVTNAVANQVSGTAVTSLSCAPATTTSMVVIDAIGWVTTSAIDVTSGQTIRAIGTNATANNCSLMVSTTTGQASSTTVTGTLTGAGAVASINALSIAP